MTFELDTCEKGRALYFGRTNTTVHVNDTVTLRVSSHSFQVEVTDIGPTGYESRVKAKSDIQYLSKFGVTEGSKVMFNKENIFGVNNY